tara:strand:+ start:153 stop:329 length:177 start_codon:yes stop_codon:yes gene_type:complete
MSEVVWSVNIMVGILLIAVGYVIYWVFKYDEWNPNYNVHSHIPVECESDDSGCQELGE